MHIGSPPRGQGRAVVSGPQGRDLGVEEQEGVRQETEAGHAPHTFFLRSGGLDWLVKTDFVNAKVPDAKTKRRRMDCTMRLARMAEHVHVRSERRKESRFAGLAK